MLRKLCLWLASFLPSITIPDTNGKPYLTRYFFFGKERKCFNIFLHHFHASDMDRSENGSLLLHDHPWWLSWSFILVTGYSEERRRADGSVGRRAFPAGSINFLTDKDFHRVDLLGQDGWSLFITTWRRKNKSWGFWDRDTGVYTDFETALAKLGKDVVIPSDGTKKMAYWLLIVLTIVGWAFGTFSYKVATNNIDPIMMTFIITGFYLVLEPFAWFFLKFPRTLNTPGIVFTVIGALGMCGGTLSYMYALKKGTAGTVTAATSIYPALTLLLSAAFLQEVITVKKVIGIVCALAGVIILGL